jgi:hypothetical protein
MKREQIIEILKGIFLKKGLDEIADDLIKAFPQILTQQDEPSVSAEELKNAYKRIDDCRDYLMQVHVYDVSKYECLNKLGFDDNGFELKTEKQ